MDWPLARLTKHETVIKTNAELWVKSMGLAPLLTSDVLGIVPAFGPVGDTIKTPFVIDRPFLADRISVFNGDAVSGNIEMKIYNLDETAGYSEVAAAASAAQTGTNVWQTESLIEDVILCPGLYWMELVTDDPEDAEFTILGTLPDAYVGGIGYTRITGNVEALPSDAGNVPLMAVGGVLL